MQTLRVALGERSYPIHIGTGLLSDASLIVPHLGDGDVAVVTNEVVAPLYLARLRESLRAAGVPTESRDYQGVFHGFFAMVGLLDTAETALTDACGALRDALGASTRV